MTERTTGTLSILLVDDAEGVRKLLRIILEAKGGFQVIGEAGDGAQAIDLAAELRPDLVLLDMAMPVMDGLQALPRILAESPGSKVVVLSGFAAEKLEKEALELGAHAYLEKGIDAVELVSRLSDLDGLRPS